MAKGQTDFVKAYERHKFENVALREFNIYNPSLKKYCEYKAYASFFHRQSSPLYLHNKHILHVIIF
jgi:hypothetical protein